MSKKEKTDVWPNTEMFADAVLRYLRYVVGSLIVEGPVIEPTGSLAVCTKLFSLVAHVILTLSYGRKTNE